MSILKGGRNFCPIVERVPTVVLAKEWAAWEAELSQETGDACPRQMLGLKERPVFYISLLGPRFPHLHSDGAGLGED